MEVMEKCTSFNNYSDFQEELNAKEHELAQMKSENVNRMLQEKEAQENNEVKTTQLIWSLFIIWKYLNPL